MSETSEVPPPAEPAAPPPEHVGVRDEAARDEDALEAAWADVEARWDAPEAHKKFLFLADQLDRLAEAGRRYRAVRDADEARRVEASKRIDELFGYAMRRIQVERTPPSAGRSRIEWIGLGLSVVLITAALYAMVRMAGG